MRISDWSSDVCSSDLHELKYDGYRCLLAKSADQIRAYTRSGLDWSEKFSEIVASAPDIDVDSALLDGEIVWLGPEGKPDFSGLQAALKSGGKGLTYFVFDLLEVDGEDLTRLPNILRKERLRGLIPGQRDAVIQYADHIVGEGEKLLRLMCDAGQEGIKIGRAHV